MYRSRFWRQNPNLLYLYTYHIWFVPVSKSHFKLLFHNMKNSDFISSQHQCQIELFSTNNTFCWYGQNRKICTQNSFRFHTQPSKIRASRDRAFCGWSHLWPCRWGGCRDRWLCSCRRIHFQIPFQNMTYFQYQSFEHLLQIKLFSIKCNFDYLRRSQKICRKMSSRLCKLIHTGRRWFLSKSLCSTRK